MSSSVLSRKGKTDQGQHGRAKTCYHSAMDRALALLHCTLATKRMQTHSFTRVCLEQHAESALLIDAALACLNEERLLPFEACLSQAACMALFVHCPRVLGDQSIRSWRDL